MEKNPTCKYEVRCFLSEKFPCVSAVLTTFNDIENAIDEARLISTEQSGVLFVKRITTAIVFICKDGKEQSK